MLSWRFNFLSPNHVKWQFVDANNKVLYKLVRKSWTKLIFVNQSGNQFELRNKVLTLFATNRRFYDINQKSSSATIGGAATWFKVKDSSGNNIYSLKRRITFRNIHFIVNHSGDVIVEMRDVTFKQPFHLTSVFKVFYAHEIQVSIEHGNELNNLLVALMALITIKTSGNRSAGAG